MALATLALPAMMMAGQWTPTLDSLARATETKWSLPHGTCHAFARQESGIDPYATRFEINYWSASSRYARTVRGEALIFSRQHSGIPSFYTEVAQRSMSWGYFQLMGQNLRSIGVSHRFLGQLGPAEQFDTFGQFVVMMRKRWPRTEDWVAAFNAGSPRRLKSGAYINQSYVTAVTRMMREYGG